MHKVSIVVPVYNVEKYIERCALSLINQTLEDIEIIFVDDCTPDKSIDILKDVIKSFPESSNKIKLVLNEKNIGLPSSRRKGFEQATGEYVAHCDSDDWVDPDMYRLLYNKAISEDLDIVYCDYYKTDGNEKTLISQAIQPKLMQGPIWNKLIRRSLYIDYDIKFPIANKAEDGALMTQLSFYARRIGYISQALYYYYINPYSICQQNSADDCLKKLTQECINTEFKVNFLKVNNSIDQFETDIILWKMLSRRNLLPIINEKKYYDLWLNTFPEINYVFLKKKTIPLRSKFAYILMRLRLYRVFKPIIIKWL